jgi:uncharacterized membrane protein YsdA (DUF1294 family)/cold shock CspA family protein
VRHQGRISSWKDEQGFGYITPNGGGQPVFVHIKSFSSRQRRPAGNELVTYALTHDARGRPQAGNVDFVGRRAPAAAPSGRGNVPLILAAAFLAFVTGSVLTGRLPGAVAGFYLAASVAAFVAYALDKSAAKNDRWRTRESTLHLFALAGGWPGALAAQRLLRHKSSKQSFQTAYWATVILNCCALAWLLSDAGSAALRSVLGTA